MKNVLIFLVLIVLVVCPPPIGVYREIRETMRKEFQKEMIECLLGSEINPELKKHIEENKEDDLRKVLRSSIPKINLNDREIIRQCREELSRYIRENHIGKSIGPNITVFERFKEKLHERKNFK